jgi:hypothetical protein
VVSQPFSATNAWDGTYTGQLVGVAPTVDPYWTLTR